MKKFDGRKNADTPQTFEELRWISQKDMEKKIDEYCKGRIVWNLFSGSSKQGDIRVDFKNFENVSLVADVFEIIRDLKPNSIDAIIADPPFVLYNGPGRNYCVWKSAVKKGILPKSMLDSWMFGHPNQWQRVVYSKIKPGGFLLTKRNITNCTTLPPHPQMFYVHDSRPSAMIVRIDRK